MHCYNYELNLDNMVSVYCANPIRMYCSNCFIEMETRVERVNRWYGPIAGLWNKMLVLIGMAHFLFGSNRLYNQENLELIFSPVARFGIKGTSTNILHTCPICEYIPKNYIPILLAISKVYYFIRNK